MNANNNPLNVKGPDKWKGSSRFDERGHAVFTDPAMGVRAAMRTLQSKWHNGKRTLREIIEGKDEDGDGKPEGGWAPADDTQGSLPGRPANDPEDYASTVAQRAGIDAGQELPAPESDVDLWAKILHEMSRFEMGEYCPWIVVYKGIVAWWQDFVVALGK